MNPININVQKIKKLYLLTIVTLICCTAISSLQAKIERGTIFLTNQSNQDITVHLKSKYGIHKKNNPAAIVSRHDEKTTNIAPGKTHSFMFNRRTAHTYGKDIQAEFQVFDAILTTNLNEQDSSNPWTNLLNSTTKTLLNQTTDNHFLLSVNNNNEITLSTQVA